MSKVYSIPAEFESRSFPRGDAGTVRAHTRVNIVDLQGISRMKRVSIGVNYNADLETARKLVNSARDANRDLHIEANFSISL